MKVLFIGEGRNDIGDSTPNPYQPRPAQGTIPALARRVCADIEPESVALAWSEIRRFNPAAKKAGFPPKVLAAVLLAVRKFDCHGTILVADRDRDTGREAELQEGVDRAKKLFANHPTAWGLAVESVEAWTLGVPDKIAEELGVPVKLVQQQYPGGTHVESLVEGSGKPDHRPKLLLNRIAQLTHRNDSTDFRQAVAERTDVEALERACPQGFAPFAEKLRAAFGQVS